VAWSGFGNENFVRPFGIHIKYIFILSKFRRAAAPLNEVEE
jgi:hypothetical protein